jgi:hypothetical protein
MLHIQLRILPKKLRVNRSQVSVCPNDLLIPRFTEHAVLSEGRQPSSECQDTCYIRDGREALSAPNEPWKLISKSLECWHGVVRAEIPEPIFTLYQINSPPLVLPE